MPLEEDTMPNVTQFCNPIKRAEESLKFQEILCSGIDKPEQKTCSQLLHFSLYQKAVRPLRWIKSSHRI